MLHQKPQLDNDNDNIIISNANKYLRDKDYQESFYDIKYIKVNK